MANVNFKELDFVGAVSELRSEMKYLSSEKLFLEQRIGLTDELFLNSEYVVLVNRIGLLRDVVALIGDEA
jgi:hypothetical protein